MDRHDLVINGARLRVLEAGSPNAPGVVVLHGIMGHGREWDVLTRRLAGHAHVHVVEQRGHGDSDRADSYALSDFAADVVAVLEHFGPALVVGHSLGGLAALRACGDGPELFTGLTVLDIGPDSITPDSAAGLSEFLRFLGASSYADVDEAMAPWTEGNPLIRPDLLRHYVTHGTRRQSDGRLVWKFHADGLATFPGSVSPADLWDAVDHIPVPTLVVRGEHSPFFGADAAEHMLSRLAHGKEVTIEGGGHDLGVEQPEAVAVAVLEFLAETTAQPRSR